MRMISEDTIYNVKVVLNMDGLVKTDREIAEFFGISRTTVGNIRRHGDTVAPRSAPVRNTVISTNAQVSVEKPQGKGRRFVPNSVKLAVIDDYENSTLTIREIADKHNVGYTSVYRWVDASNVLEMDDAA